MVGTKMRVGLILPDLDGRQTGVGRYMLELTRALAETPDGPDLALLTTGGMGPLRNLGLVPGPFTGALLPTMLRLTRRVGSLGSHRLARWALGSVTTPLAVRQLGLDVVHDLTAIPALRFAESDARTVMTIHDLISWSHLNTNDWMDDLVQRRWLPRALPRLDGVIAISGATKTDIVEHLNVPAAKVRTVHLGVAPRFRPLPPAELATVKARHGLPDRYMLFVGSADERKNLHRLIDACIPLWQDGERRPLVVAGPPSPRYDALRAKLAALDLEDRVVFMGFAPDDVLPHLYGGADVFVYPSLYEGFGLPPLEAMACGTPVVTSNISSLPEVVGEAAVTVDPYDVQALTQALAAALTDSALRAELREQGLARAAEFTWQRAARETIDVYHKVCA